MGAEATFLWWQGGSSKVGRRNSKLAWAGLDGEYASVRAEPARAPAGSVNPIALYRRRCPKGALLAAPAGTAQAGRPARIRK